MTTRIAAEAVKQFLVENEAWWEWDGHAHVARLTSGKVSDFYANLSPLYTVPALQEAASLGLLSLLQESCGSLEQFVDGSHKNMWVVGSAMGGIWIASGVAAKLNCRCAYTEKVETTPLGKIANGNGVSKLPSFPKMILNRFDLGEKPYIILVEDVLTTGGTTQATVAALLDVHPDAEFCGDALVIVNRSGWNTFACASQAQTFRVRSLISVKAHTWYCMLDLPPKMAMCEALRPKGSWSDLVSEKLSSEEK